MSRLEKLMGRKLTPKDQAQNADRVASLKREVAVTPSESWANEMARKGYGRKLYRKRGNKRWLTRPPEGQPYEWALRYRPNDGHGKMSRAAAAVGEAMAPAWRIGTARAAAQPVPERETRVARGLAGVFASGMTEREAAQFCERCERRRAFCECGGR